MKGALSFLSEEDKEWVNHNGGQRPCRILAFAHAILGIGNSRDRHFPHLGSPRPSDSNSTKAGARSRFGSRLITILPRKGILVSDINPRNQLLVLEVRRELERLLSRTGAERATGAQRARLQDIARGMDQAARRNDDIAFMRLDRELNALMIACAHNDYTARSMKLLQGLSRRFWYMHYREAADLPLCARLHANQARAIAKGDAEAAARASDKLMDYVESFTRATVSV